MKISKKVQQTEVYMLCGVNVQNQLSAAAGLDWSVAEEAGTCCP